jgi:hypothetical protein
VEERTGLYGMDRQAERLRAAWRVGIEDWGGRGSGGGGAGGTLPFHVSAASAAARVSKRCGVAVLALDVTVLASKNPTKPRARRAASAVHLRSQKPPSYLFNLGWKILFAGYVV